jgi:predicted polyphosphate/ATP-dependent NAD kinase
MEKLISLRGQPLIVDTGDELLNESLRGYQRVVTGFDEFHII